MSSTGQSAAPCEAVEDDLRTACDNAAKGDRQDGIEVAGRDAKPITDSAATTAPNDALVSKVGQLTRKLHETLRELGYDRALESAVHQIPDARERLTYVADMTEQAATRTLGAVEAARAIQAGVDSEAASLILAWERFFEARVGTQELWQLAEETSRFLHAVRQQGHATNAHLLEVMMAQEFQDLIGQVIRKVTQAAQDLERQLLELLVDSVSPEKRQQFEESGVLLGPVINGAGRNDLVTSQSQVDDLLESLGF
jgi:chemotaxis protein CheZ